MPILYTKEAQAVYLKGRDDAAELIQTGHSLEQANHFLRSELAWALNLDQLHFQRQAQEAGPGYVLVHEVVSELAA